MIGFDRIRKLYWAVSKYLSLVRFSMDKKNRVFGKEAFRNYIQKYGAGPKPVLSFLPGPYAEQTVKWLMRAQDKTPDKGVSHGYFPCGRTMGWRPSYPETTGYIIPSLIDYGKYIEDDQIIKRAIDMAEWESEVQMPSGAVQGGVLTSADKQKPAVFNTGMVLQGWTSAFRETGDDRFFDSGRKAADFLMADMDSRGHYRTHGSFVAANEIKTYNVLCSWALFRFGEDSGKAIYKEAAVKNAEATLLMQQPNGWFQNCCLTDPENPLTHTLGYTLQGLLEIGVRSGREDFIAASEKGIKPLIGQIRDNGYLPGRFDRKWKTKASYSCLTGSAQIAIVLYRLSRIRENMSYSKAADRLMGFLKALQLHNSPDPNMNGAVAGSFPLFGGYMTGGYPNWAAKYFLDALLLQRNHGHQQAGRR